MKVKELMTSHPRVCHPESTLGEVAQAMWETDCGALPVVDDIGRAVGMVTDRDVCMATMFGNRPPSDLRVTDVSHRTPHSCHPDDSIGSALTMMENARVRRLPVVDERDRVLGILSLNDIVRAAAPRTSKGGVNYADVVDLLKGVSAHRDLPAVTHQA